jgi:hypothetical protein
MTRLRLLLIGALLLGTLAVNLIPLSLTTRDSAIFVPLSPSVALAGGDGIDPPRLLTPPQPLGDGIDPPRLLTPPQPLGDGIDPPRLSPYR